LIKASNLKSKVEELLNLIAQDQYAYPPEFEFLKGDLKGAISRRINKQHRLVYEVLEKEQAIKIIMMWSHYE
jgi:Txe/YoeB family toxin of toxin-antitoxin system